MMTINKNLLILMIKLILKLIIIRNNSIYNRNRVDQNKCYYILFN